MLSSEANRLEFKAGAHGFDILLADLNRPFVSEHAGAARQNLTTPASNTLYIATFAPEDAPCPSFAPGENDLFLPQIRR